MELTSRVTNPSSNARRQAKPHLIRLPRGTIEKLCTPTIISSSLSEFLKEVKDRMITYGAIRAKIHKGSLGATMKSNSGLAHTINVFYQLFRMLS